MEKLSKLLSPIGTEEFFDRYWRKEPLLVIKENEFEQLISLEEINDYLGKPSLTYPLVRLVGNGKEVDFETYKLRSVNSTFNFINKEALFRKLSEGSTLVIQASQLQFPNLRSMVRHLEHELKMDVNANIYITPSNSKGFYPHVDTHEVIACQVYGSKNWNIYNIPYIAPIPDFNLSIEESQNYLKTEPAHKIKLEPGDLLYIPRGVVHDAFSDGEYSIHITFGFTTLLNLEILQQVVREAEKLQFFRESFKVPNRDITASDRTQFVKKATSIINDMIRKVEKQDVHNPKYTDTTDIFYKLFFLDNLNKLEGLGQIEMIVKDTQPEGLTEDQFALFQSISDGNVLEENNEKNFAAVKSNLKALLLKGCIDIDSLVEE